MRKPIGFLILLAWLAAYVSGASMLADWVFAGPRWAEPVFFIIAGIAWIIPLKPLFGWMNKGADFGLDAED